MSYPIALTTDADLTRFKQKRLGESHVADVISIPSDLDLLSTLNQAKLDGVTTVFVGVPEDIGPRANCGNGGADKGWPAFLNVLLNQQANQMFDWSKCLLLGHVVVNDFLAKSHLDPSLSNLRQLCADIDTRVKEVLTPIFDLDFNLVVIGGGHNNAYPILTSLSTSAKSQVSCVNLDPHADFRNQEGRHSGNPFRYAFADGILAGYHVFGLHEQKNNQDTLTELSKAGFSYTSYQSLFIRQDQSIEDSMQQALVQHQTLGLPSGVELDIDAIKYAAASAFSVSGFTLEQAARYVFKMSSNDTNRYLHICESAPTDTQQNEAGQAIMQLVYSYLIAKHPS
ncbi:formimidoylglutamase [Psychrosphaera sp. B3R10]|uniref:Formimidoylglutamase n=1 Tax=Psychrosphaera algicola TaxID=3023714 RepID=A0ABT5FE56_9GAMM|nr:MULTISPECIES: formimidoylglutamase [unclassified Psychrosphaera]MBU2880360.1 formimidoylglutamase [Psychrosphaera sp. I2R16]MBU2987799.1 formimidoylglutamase [Psychrosphaera sp. B3R10]MDC2889153.1 formimidoylglutamase [Psychrosphaera sp. G1-22]